MMNGMNFSVNVSVGEHEGVYWVKKKKKITLFCDPQKCLRESDEQNGRTVLS